jgi:glycosyltransferase involved in cell wall biosynthesis
VLLTVGRLASEERYKGFDEVLEALPELARERSDIAYLICGDGPDRPRLEAKAAALGIMDRVRFAGFVSEGQKGDFYRLADAYVMPSRGEGFGIVFLEALACGLPVLGSTADGSREALLDGAVGELVDPDDRDAIRNGILRTLVRGKHVPPELEQFSQDSFRARVAAFTRAALA